MRPRALALAASLAAGPLWAADPWYTLYEQGLQALDSHQWVVAEAKLREAQRIGPKPGRQVRAYGVRFLDFLPGFHLGVALFHQQRYTEALAELKRVEAGGLVRSGDPEATLLADLLRQSSAQLAPKEASPSPSAIVRATPSEAPVAPRLPSPTPPASPAADTTVPGGDAPQGGSVAVQTPRATPTAAPSGAGVTEPVPHAETAPDAATQQREIAEVERLVASGQWLEAKARLSAYRGPDSRATARLRTLIEQHFRGETGRALEDAGVRAFRAGKYAVAAELLADAARRPDRTAGAIFYLACSEAALGFLDPAGREARLESARGRFAEARRVDPDFRFEAKLLSPRIRRLWEASASRR